MQLSHFGGSFLRLADAELAIVARGGAHGVSEAGVRM
jgi:hypothetical protein